MWALFILGWILPQFLAISKPSWESLGDAHFYASSAQHWADHGENRWHEIYPIALNERAGSEMAFPSPAFPLVASWGIRLGLSAPEATLYASGLALAGTLSLFYLWALSRGLSIPTAWAIGLMPLLGGESLSLALRGGSDSLGQFGLVLSTLLLFYHQQSQLNRRRLILLFTSALLALIRPHNQIFLLLLGPTLLIIEWRGARWLSLAHWLLAIVFWKLIQTSLLNGGDITFPYSFSFLVSTQTYPDHSLFRHYFPEGFSLSFIFEHGEDLKLKALKGLGLLKMYWTGWIPQSLILGFSFFLSKKKAPVLLLLVLLASAIFLSCSGHLIPRYWTILFPLSLLAALVSIPTSNQLLWGIGTWALLGALVTFTGGRGQELLFSPLPQRELHATPFPEQWVKPLKDASTVACDHPAKAIDALSRPLLLMPQNPTILNRIESDHGSVEHLLFSPNFKAGELSHWEEHFSLLEETGYRRHEVDNWTLFSK